MYNTLVNVVDVSVVGDTIQSTGVVPLAARAPVTDPPTTHAKAATAAANRIALMVPVSPPHSHARCACGAPSDS